MTREQALEEYLRRVVGIVSPSFRGKSILIVGVGAGSYEVEKLARFCPRELKLCDFDRVEISNLVRTAYTYEDAVLGRLKVDAMAARVQAINPFLGVVTYPYNILEMTRDELDDLFDGADLVVAGTDQFAAQALVNREAVRRGIPAVFNRNQAGARVVWSVPGETGCYRCVAEERYEAAEESDSSVDLVGAAGSLADCQFIDMIALKVCLAILERDSNSVMGRFYQAMKGRNDVVVRCDPTEGWANSMWKAVLSDLPKEPRDFAAELEEQVLLAMDSMWLPAARNEACPDCGK